MNVLSAALIFCFSVAAYGFPGSQIVGGKDAPSGMFPYQAAIKIQGYYFCGGSILNSRYILSTARCVLRSPSSYEVYVGTTQLNASGVAYHVEKKIAHPDFNQFTYINDVGLVRVSKDIVFTKLIQPIKLATGSTTYEGLACVLSGWGSIKPDANEPTNNLQYINLVVEKQAVCKVRYPDLQASNICTDRKFGEGAWIGGSGSPLVSNGLQIGINSYVSGGNGFPDYYTRVSSFVDWIEAQQSYLMDGDVDKLPVDTVYIV